MGLLDEFYAPDYSKLKRGQFRQDTPKMREYAANVPVDLLRGRLAGLLGLPSDVANMVRTLMPTEMMGGPVEYEEPTQVPYGTDFMLKNLPLAPAADNPLGRVAGQAGALVPLTPMEIARAARPAVRAATELGKFVAPKAGQLAENYMQRMGVMPGIIEKANPNTVWYRGQTGAKSAENPFDSTIRGTPSLADSPAVASEYAMNPNAAGNYGLLGAGEDVSGAVVQPYTTSGKVFNINEYQGGFGTETGITQENLKKIAKELGVDPSKLTDELMENFSQKWGSGKDAYWDATERGSKSKNKIIPAWVVAENQTLIDAAKKKGLDSIQFKGTLSDANDYNPLLPWSEKVTHQELRPLNREAIKSTFSPVEAGGLLEDAPIAKAAGIKKKSQSVISQPRMSAAEARDAGYWHSIGAGKKLPIPISEMTARLENAGLLSPKLTASPEAMQNAAIFPFHGDRSAAGKNLLGIGDTNFETPVYLEGGYDFMRANAPNREIWAADKGSAQGLQNRIDEAAKIGGGDVFGVYSAMGPDSMNFNTMMSDALLEQIRAGKISKKNIAAFDKEVASLRPEWKGVMNPESRAQLESNGALRHVFVNRMQLDDFQKVGFPNIAYTRYGITDPLLLNEPMYSGGLAIGKMQPDSKIITNPMSPHKTYNTQLTGDYIGGFEQSVPKEVLYPDWYKKRRMDNTPISGDVRSFQLSNPIQPTNQEWLDGVMQYLANQKSLLE